MGVIDFFIQLNLPIFFLCNFLCYVHKFTYTCFENVCDFIFKVPILDSIEFMYIYKWRI